MSDTWNERLNKILPRLITDEFLSGSGILFNIDSKADHGSTTGRDLILTGTQCGRAKIPADHSIIAENPIKPVLKSRGVIKPVDVVNQDYLETENDVDQFVAKLRSELTKAIENGERIEIR